MYIYIYIYISGGPPSRAGGLRGPAAPPAPARDRSPKKRRRNLARTRKVCLDVFFLVCAQSVLCFKIPFKTMVAWTRSLELRVARASADGTVCDAFIVRRGAI